LLNRTLGEAGPIAGQFVSGLVDRVGGSLSQTTLDFAKFSAAANAAGISLKLQQDVFEQTAVASLAFGLSTEQSARALQALQQIASKGVVSMEEVRQQLGEQLPVAIAAAAKGAGVPIAELIEMISSGGYEAEEFFKAYAKGMKEFNKGAAGAETAQVAFRKFEGALENLQVTYGKGILPTITDRVKDLTAAAKGLGLSLKASKVSGGDGLLGWLGIQGFAGKQVTGWQQALLSRGTLTESEVNALITDSVKDIEGKVYNALGRINIDPANAASIYDVLFEKVLEYEEKVKGRTNGSAAEAEVKRLLDLEKARLAKLAQINSELTRSEALAVAQGKALYGPETLKVIEAQIRLAQATRQVELFPDQTTDKAKDAASAQLVAAEAAAQTIRDAYKDARDAALDAADAFGEARTKRAAQLFNRNEGINKYLGGGALRSRQVEGVRMQKAEAARLAKELQKQFKEQGNEAAAKQIANIRFRGNNQQQFEQRQGFIDAARDELYGNKALITANENLTKAMNDLQLTIAKGFDGGSTAQREDFQQLKSSIDDLTKKDWTVGVDARLESDGSINITNALS
jgi:tape measure domain-containing protein